MRCHITPAASLKFAAVNFELPGLLQSKQKSKSKVKNATS
jgi:hypothetical protein